MNAMLTVLFATIDSPEAETRAALLRMEGFLVLECEVGSQVMDMTRRSNPAVIVLDARLLENEGVLLCRTLRAEVAVPIVVLAAQGDDTQHIAALEFGADDYLVEPLSAGVFLARVRAALRRSQPGALSVQHEVIREGAIVVDITAHRVWRSGIEVSLNKKEVDMPTYLMRRSGAVVSRNDLQQHAWGHTRVLRTLDVYMMQLRRKLEREPSRPEYLLTVRHKG